MKADEEAGTPLADYAAARVGEIIAAAERKAAEIEADARDEAERILADARRQAEQPGGAQEAPEAAESASAESESAGPESAAQPDPAARLVAMKMALDGSSREEVAGHLAEELGISDSEALLDDVFARAGR